MAADSKARLLREGERYVQQGKISLAINQYLKITREDPDDILTLNTIGDLYLWQGRESEANRLFLRVAENYAQNNFLLKAIAVYKKILNTEPNNLEVNLLLASLYERQGINVDTRSQYLFIGDLCAREGKTSESIGAYEKVVEIDPMNAPIQLKLAETYLAQGSNDKAYLLFAGAARAQMKSGDIATAMASFRRALAINLTSTEALKGFLETALQSGDPLGALDQVKEFLSEASDDLAIQELLGRIYQAAGELERAEQCFLAVVNSDGGHYTNLMPLSKAFLEAGDPDRALHCLNPIVPILICNRETEKLVEAYNRILETNPVHLPTLNKLAEILSAANDDLRHVATLEKIAQLNQDSGSPAEALESLKKILEIYPDSQKYLAKHRELFEQAFPGTPYRLPRGVTEARRGSVARLEVPSGPVTVRTPGNDSSSSAIVEIDLLLNYGLKEKALQLLRDLEATRPSDKEVRLRLISLYGETGELQLAAEQCVLLSTLHRKAGDIEAAEKAWGEAGKLAPDWVNSGLDVMAFAQAHGISLEPTKVEAPRGDPNGSLEVDLSGDLSEIFFKDVQGMLDREDRPSEGVPDAAVEEFPQEIPKSPVPESLEEQLQEVDFYIRLGFHDEARAKLDEIAASRPHQSELAPRYAQLGLKPVNISDAIVLAPPEPSSVAPAPTPAEPGLMAAAAFTPADVEEASPAVCTQDLLVSDPDSAADHFGENKWFELASDFRPPASDLLPNAGAGENDLSSTSGRMSDVLTDGTPAAGEPVVEVPANAMFADLIAEVNSLTDQQIAREDFETHFSLGIAFREMGLTEDAIKEFQNSVKALDPAKSPKEVIQCCWMLSTCFLEKGMPRSAMRWCQTGLGIKEICPHEAMALRYDMGAAHASVGDSGKALECFGMIFGIDPGYRDVAQRIDDFKIGLERHAP